MKKISPASPYLTVVVAFVVGTAFAAGPTVRTMVKSDIPRGFAIGSGEPPLALKIQIVDGQVNGVVATDTADANVTASGSTEDGEATLSIRHELDVALKFDLYISADGERFEYTSSCAVTPGISSFELWQQPVRAFALGNPRVIRDGRIVCN